MQTLEDDDDLFLSRPLGLDEPPRRRFSLRPLLIALAVIVLGGGLGTGAYFLSNLDSRALIGLLDVADQPPRLAIQMPGRGPAGGAAGELLEPMLHPPGAAGSGEGEGAGAPAAEAPAQAAAPTAVAPPTVGAGSVVAPIIVRQESAQGPVQPLPRPADKAPSLAALPVPPRAKPLGPVPAEGMTNPSVDGPLPVIAADGRQSWQVYARPFDAKDNRPRLAVIVAGLGLDRETTDLVIERMPADVTLAFSPYAPGLDMWVQKARDTGHEVLLGLPVEESGYPTRDPGPWGLTTSARPEDNARRLLKVLARTAGYVGVLVLDGPFVKSAQLPSLLVMLKERGLLYAGSGAAADPRPPTVAMGGWVDGEVFRDAVDSRLKAAAQQTRERGSQAVLVNPRPASLESVVPWLASLSAEGVTLAPVSALIGQGGKS